jgi:hypothetical protein
LVPYDPVLEVGGALKAYSFQRASRPNDTYVVIWAASGLGTLRLPIAPDRLELMRPFGKAIPVQTEGGRPIVTIGGRCYLRFKGMTPAEARRVLRRRD